MSKSKKLSLEESFAQLEALVGQLNEDIPLEQSLDAFERGIKLLKEAQQTLTAAEQKVALLIEQNGAPTEVPLDAEDDE